jgi:hypothetical protein
VTADDLTFASIGPAGVVHHAHCDSCQVGQHPGGWHSWAGPDDVEHAAKTGQPDPSDKRCGCHCTDQPATEDLPEPPDIDVESLGIDPCPVCGEPGACGYDAEGRPLIHTDWADDE